MKKKKNSFFHEKMRNFKNLEKMKTFLKKKEYFLGVQDILVMEMKKLYKKHQKKLLKMLQIEKLGMIYKAF